MENFIIFPINLEWNAGRRRWLINDLTTEWKTITQSVDIQQSIHYGCITGRIGKITVLEFSKQAAADLFPQHTLDSAMFDITPSRNIRYYFQYEEKLDSIYNIVPGFNVINNNRFIPMGKMYTIMRKRELEPMQPEMVDIILKLQQAHEAIPIAQHFYDLVAPLPDKWFNRRDYFVKVIHAIRNTLMTEETRLATIKKILVDRFDYYDEHLVQPELDKTMNYTERRFGIPALSKIIKAESPDVYKAWHDKWKARKRVTPPPPEKTRFRYKYGASAALADIKAIQPGITAKKLLEMNAQFTASKIMICKHCRNKCLVGCCKNYKRLDHTTSTIIANIELC